jgi:hypothetical protein
VTQEFRNSRNIRVSRQQVGRQGIFQHARVSFIRGKPRFSCSGLENAKELRSMEGAAFSARKKGSRAVLASHPEPFSERFDLIE